MDIIYKYLPNTTNSKKLDEWLKRTTDYYINNVAIDDIRDKKNMQENYDVISGILNNDIANKIINPMSLPQTKNDINLKDEIIPVILPTYNTLIGEMYDRNIDFRAYVINREAVSKKEEWLNQEFNKRLMEIANDTSLSEETIQLKLMELQQWKQYSAQDVRERAANHIIKDFIDKQYFQRKTKEGWKDMLANSQEIFLFDILRDNIIFEKINPLNIKIFGLPDSGNIHESEAIVHYKYMSVGEVIENYGSELKKEQIDKIIKGESLSYNTGGIMMIMDEEVKEKENGTILYFDNNNNTFDLPQMRKGLKILTRTAYFKVLREIKKLHFINESGEEEIKLVDINYKEDEESGEWCEKEYINEFWQSTKIFDDIYVNTKRCPVQMRDMNNPSSVYAPIVGIILKTDKRITKSVIDYLKVIQHKWTIFSKKVELLWARNMGKLVKIDISKIPKKYGFDVDLFMAWITSYGIIIEDPFNEAMKGQAAGQFTSSVQSVDMELSSSISQALQYMMYLRELADEFVGVNRQRRGQLMASDGLGTTQVSIAHSIKTTEELFQEHHHLQRILLQYILEYSKTIIMDSKTDKKFQYLTDEMIYILFKIDSEMFKDVDYGITINNTSRELQMDQIFMQLVHAFAQNGAIKLSEIMELYTTKSFAEKINKLKLKEKEQELMRQQSQKAEQEAKEELLRIQQEHEQRLHEMEMELQRLKNEGLIMVAQINSSGKINEEEIKSETDKTIAQSKNNIDIQKSLINYKQNKDKK